MDSLGLKAVDATKNDYNSFQFLSEMNLEGIACQSYQEWWRLTPFIIFLTLEEKKVGYIQYGIRRRPVGIIVTIFVHPDMRGIGGGKILMRAVAKRLHDHGCKHWGLRVPQDNDFAVRLFCSMKLAVISCNVTYRIPWSNLDTNADSREMGSSMCHLSVTGPEEDENIEKKFNLPLGKLQSFRSSGVAAFKAVSFEENTSEIRKLDKKLSQHAQIQNKMKVVGILCFRDNICDPFVAVSSQVARQMLCWLTTKWEFFLQNEDLNLVLSRPGPAHLYILNRGGYSCGYDYEMMEHL